MNNNIFVVFIVVCCFLISGCDSAASNSAQSTQAATDAATSCGNCCGVKDGVDAGAPNLPTTAIDAQLPKLIDLGSDKCDSCLKMKPVLEQLAAEYQGRMAVEFIDVNKNRKLASLYTIRLIPTQIFFNAADEELFRHEGFISKEDILKKWQELGINLEQQPK